MKVSNWNDLESLGLIKIGEGKYRKDWNIYYYKESCGGCHEPYLGIKSSTCCCLSCAVKGERGPMFGKHHSEETKRKMSEKHKKGNTYTKRNIPSYNVYAPQIEWCEEIRRNAEDPNILEVKCTYCGRWFVPKRTSVVNRVSLLKGLEGYNGEHRFYCGDNCKKACPIYHKRAETLMKEDAVRSGLISYKELNREVQPELRRLVLKRDNYKCVKCSSEGPLHCHHILPVVSDPLESADIDNCLTLCDNCHRKVHKQPGCGYNEFKSCKGKEEK